MENQSFVVGSNSSMWSLSPATCNKLEPILCIEEPKSSLPDSTVSLLRLSLMNATDVLLDIHDRLCIHVHTGRANLSANVGVGTWIRFDGYWVQEALCLETERMKTTLPCKCHVHTEVLKSANLFQSVFPNKIIRVNSYVKIMAASLSGCHSHEVFKITRWSPLPWEIVRGNLLTSPEIRSSYPLLRTLART